MKVASFWAGGPLNKIQELSLSSFVYYGHSIFLYVYDQGLKVPNGVVKRDANLIIDESDMFIINGQYAPFSDLFRLKMIKKDNITWVDADTICVTSDWGKNNSTVAAFESGNISGSVLYLPPKSSALDFLITEAESYNRSSIKWSEIGSGLLNIAFNKYGLSEYVAAEEDYCGICYLHFHKLWNPSNLDEVLDLASRAKGISAYNKMVTTMYGNSYSFPQMSAMDYFYDKFVA